MKSLFLARDVIYTSRAYAMMPVSVCPSVCPSVCDVCALWSQGAMDPRYLCMLGCLYYLLTTPDLDRPMGWCRDFWWKRGYGKSGNYSDIAYFTHYERQRKMQKLGWFGGL